MNSLALTRTLLIYGLTLPLAVVLGYMLTTPDQSNSLMVVGVVAFVLTMPLLIRWHHPVLIFSWNAMIVLAFFPGAPHFWMLMAVLSLGFAMVNRLLDRQGESTFCHVPPVTYTILFLALVVLLTAKMAGGIGLRSLGGSSYGSKGYVYILAAIVGYFALTSCPIPLKQTRLYTTLYFLPGLTALMSSLIYYAGPSFYILFAIFPTGEASNLAQADAAGSYITRLGGVSVAGTVIYYYLLSRHGIRGLFTVNKPLRLLCFVLAFGAGLFGGFRSILLLMLMVFALQFYLEGLLRTTLFPIFVIVGVFSMVLVIPLADRLPMAVQRSLAFLPGIEVNPQVRYDAENSTEWRVQMWRVLLPDLHKYLLLGKGYSINPTDMYLTDMQVRSGKLADWETSIEVGDYHSGPLSIYIPFGSFGVLAFVSFLIASIRTLYQNYLHGDPHLKTINAILLSMFVARSISFFFVFGAISSELFQFTGLIGFSVALNGGVKKAPSLLAVKPTPATA